MPLLKATSAREQLLIAVLGVSLLIGGYLMLRVQPQLLAQQVLQEQLQDSRTRLKETRPLRPDGQSSGPLRQQIDQLEAQIEQERRTLAGFEKDFVDLSESDAIANMRGRITERVQRSGLRLRSIRRSQTDLQQFSKEPQSPDNPLDRPLFDIELEGDYFELSRLMDELGRLPHNVVIISLALRVDETVDGDGSRLSAQLTLGF